MALNIGRAVLRFLGRLFRDIWLEIWKPIRRIVIRWGALTIAALLIFLLISSYPATFATLAIFVAAAAIMWFGFKLVTFPFRARKGQSR